MKFWHVQNVDDRFGCKRGVIVERYAGKVERLNLLLSVRGFCTNLHFIDHRKGVLPARTDYWVRLCWNGKAFWFPRFECFYGSNADPRLTIGDVVGTARIYQAVAR